MQSSSPESTRVDLLEIQAWSQYWAEIERCIAPLFPRSEPRQRAMIYLAGLLSSVERKNSWQLAEITGDSTPYAFQHLFGCADWNPNTLCDLLFTYVTDYLSNPDTIGVIDETGFLKKGIHSVGVQRQYSGTVGRPENYQIGFFLTYATAHSHTFGACELYLPAEWADDVAPVNAQAFQWRLPLPRNPPLPSRCLNAHALQVYGWLGSQVIRCMETIPHFEAPWSSMTKPVCLPFPVKSTFGLTNDSSRSRRY